MDELANARGGPIDGLSLEIGRRLDPTQTDRSAFIEWAFRGHPVIATIVTALGGDTSVALLTDHQRFTGDLQVLADAAGSISKHGWALSKYTPLTGCRRALEMKQAGASIDQIDHTLTDAWNKDSGPRPTQSQ